MSQEQAGLTALKTSYPIFNNSQQTTSSETAPTVAVGNEDFGFMVLNVRYLERLLQ
jgi:hypothetical protein